VRCTETCVVALADTLNVADPTQTVAPSAEVTVRMIVNPVPVGIPPTEKASPEALERSTVPLLENELGPEIE